jgi:hypothetical protein
MQPTVKILYGVLSVAPRSARYDRGRPGTAARTASATGDIRGKNLCNESAASQRMTLAIDCALKYTATINRH